MSQAPETLTNPQAQKLLDELLLHNESKSASLRSIRNHCIALLMLDAGLRVGEVVQLLQSDLIRANEPVTGLWIRSNITKNKSQRIVPLSIRIKDSLKIMQHHWWNPSKGTNTLDAFFALDSPNPLSARQIQRIIKRAAITALGRPIHPHILRHTFASNLMRITNARVVQELLGHKQLSSTQVYCHPNQTDLTNAIRDLGKKPVNNSQNT